jgi:hypothetical protein
MIKVCQQLLCCLVQLLLQLPEADPPHICRVAALQKATYVWGRAALQMAWRRVLRPCVWQPGSLLNRVPVLPALKCVLGKAVCGPATEFVLAHAACCFIA